MRDQRGFSFVELLVGTMLSALVAGGLLSMYFATTRTVGESNTQAALQRQGTLVLDQIARQVRSGMGPNAVSVVTCNGVAGSVQISTPSGNVCYYAAADGALCQFQQGPQGTCRNLLRGGLKTIVLLTQPTPADPRCPATVAAGNRCFAMAPNVLNPTSQVDVAFALRDGDEDLDGVNAMAFSISATCSGRNC